MPRKVWAFWREYGAAIGNRQTTIWLWIVYLLLIGPTWLVTRIVGRSFFVRAGEQSGYWVRRPKGPASVADMRRMG